MRGDLDCDSAFGVVGVDSAHDRQAGPDGGPPRAQAPGRALRGRNRGVRRRESEVVMGLGQDPDIGVLGEEALEAGGVFGDAGGVLDVPGGEAEGHRGSVSARATEGGACLRAIPFVDGVRTICLRPTAEMRAQIQVLEGTI